MVTVITVDKLSRSQGFEGLSPGKILTALRKRRTASETAPQTLVLACTRVLGPARTSKEPRGGSARRGRRTNCTKDRMLRNPPPSLASLEGGYYLRPKRAKLDTRKWIAHLPEPQSPLPSCLMTSTYDPSCCATTQASQGKFQAEGPEV